MKIEKSWLAGLAVGMGVYGFIGGLQATPAFGQPEQFWTFSPFAHPFLMLVAVAGGIGTHLIMTIGD